MATFCSGVQLVCRFAIRFSSRPLVRTVAGELRFRLELYRGISSDNILHHQPAARNPQLVEALARLRLINRSNLGVARMFSAMLMEGKEPPALEDQNEAIRVTFRAQELSAPFRQFVAEEGRQGRLLTVDHLLILRHLLHHAELDTATAARLCQRREIEAREVLSEMERVRGYLERGGTGRGTYWTLRPELYARLAAPGHPERDRRLDWEAAKTRVLSVLMQRARRGEPGLSNAEVRQITHLDRRQANALLTKLKNEGEVSITGERRWARWIYRGHTSENTP